MVQTNRQTYRKQVQTNRYTDSLLYFNKFYYLGWYNLTNYTRHAEARECKTNTSHTGIYRQTDRQTDKQTDG